MRPTERRNAGRRPPRFTAVLALLALACGQGNGRPEVVTLAAVDSGPPDVPVEGDTYTQNAKSWFEHAEGLARRHETERARAEYAEAKERFPYSQYAPLEELRLIDLDFAAGHYDDCAKRYARWAREHPTNAARPQAIARAATAQCLGQDSGPCADPYDAGF